MHSTMISSRLACVHVYLPGIVLGKVFIAMVRSADTSKRSAASSHIPKRKIERGAVLGHIIDSHRKPVVGILERVWDWGTK